eukprot:scaffold5661_cov40-Phaeocystis_antarctica.AAC.1
MSTTRPMSPSSKAHAADWPRLAGAQGSLRHACSGAESSLRRASRPKMTLALTLTLTLTLLSAQARLLARRGRSTHVDVRYLAITPRGRSTHVDVQTL